MAKRNKIRKLHSALTPNRIDAPGRRRRALTVVALIAAVALCVGGVIAYGRLRDVWIEQCRIVDLARQVTVVTGSNVKPGLVLESFGIREGGNLACIDFEAKRREILTRVPNIRSLTVERRLPDRVTLTVEEREPIARIAVRGGKATGRVVDTDGVVFMRSAGTALLPVIIEGREPGTPVGAALTGRTLAALRLLEFTRKRELSDLGVLSADVSPTDYITATLGNYSRAKIAWPEMDRPTATTRDAMTNQVVKLQQAVKTRLADNTVIWNATIPNRVFADTKEPIP